MTGPHPPQSHFGNRTPLEHVTTMRALAIKETAEAHGTEIPGHLSAAADAMREMAAFLLIIWAALTLTLLPLLVLGVGFLVWKIGRSAWLGWARLERFHRVIEQEKWEIEHHRPQERDELIAIYGAKGFSGPLLDEVVDVLMADDDRLLRVMLEEELGLNLLSYEHPLKQSAGAAIGATTALLLSVLFCWIYPPLGVTIGAFLALAFAGIISAKADQNRMLSAIVWNMAIGGLAFGTTYFLFKLLI